MAASNGEKLLADTSPLGAEDETTLSRNPEPLQEMIASQGLIYSERGNLTEVFCKPKILPIKSATLKRIEELERQHDRSQTKDSTTTDQGA